MPRRAALYVMSAWLSWKHAGPSQTACMGSPRPVGLQLCTLETQFPWPHVACRVMGLRR